jgi:hypothetical protein
MARRRQRPGAHDARRKRANEDGRIWDGNDQIQGIHLLLLIVVLEVLVERHVVLVVELIGLSLARRHGWGLNEAWERGADARGGQLRWKDREEREIEDGRDGGRERREETAASQTKGDEGRLGWIGGGRGPSRSTAPPHQH